MKNNSAIVVFSGGQDSTTCLCWAQKNFKEVVAITFDYQQRHQIEIECALNITKKLQIPHHIIPLNELNVLAPNALTRNEIDIEENPNELPSTFVPGRNHLFLTYAAIYAYNHKIPNIITGVCETDYSGYPDCRADFITSIQKSLSLAMEFPFEIHTPLMNLNKKETVKLMQDLDQLEMLQHSHTCYEGERPACGTCPACKLRLKGFKEAGVKDPLEYQ